MGKPEGALPWEQLPDEPITAYRRFCIYRDLGPGRSIDRAYEAWRQSKQKVQNSTGSGIWKSNSAKYGWVDRAAAFDIHNISREGCKVAIDWVAILRELSGRVLDKLREGTLNPKSWDDVVGAANVLGAFVPVEAVEEARRLAVLDAEEEGAGR